MPDGAKPQVPWYGGLSHAQIRAQLRKILESQLFGRSERLSDFLRYVVEECPAAMKPQSGGRRP
jgi:hypothetical protein